MRHLASLLLATSLLVAIDPAPARALCAIPRMRPTVLSTGDGTAVVGTTVGTDGVANELGEAAQPTWVLKTRTGTLKPVMVEVAPGLVVYKLPLQVDAAELVNGATSIAKLARSKPAPALPAPTPTKITYKLTPNIRGNIEQTVATFADPVPADAIAVIVVDAATRKPRSYRYIEGGGPLTIYGRGRCSALPNKTVPTVAGDKVILRWVDKHGTVSADSKPIVVETFVETGPLGP